MKLLTQFPFFIFKSSTMIIILEFVMLSGLAVRIISLNGLCALLFFRVEYNFIMLSASILLSKSA